MSRDEIYDQITKERDYQDHLCTIKGMPLKPSVEGELVMLKTYLDKAMFEWTKNPTDKEALSEIRKIAGIAVRCLENHGCQPRNIMKGLSTEI